ncbi:MAG: hypothetical protein O2782_22855 [bacterium]|nr:hypothetical protein [bacterium]
MLEELLFLVGLLVTAMATAFALITVRELRHIGEIADSDQPPDGPLEWVPEGARKTVR